MKILYVPTLEAWRKWLTAHHDDTNEIWLIFYKQHTGRPSIDHKVALDEALCFGWIDSLVKRLDDQRYAIKFTPRKPDSKWSHINRARYAELKAEGRLKPPGANRPPTRRRAVAPARWDGGLPAYIRRALEKKREVWEYFESLPPSHKRRYAGWIDTAKKEETKMRRLQEAIRKLEKKEKLGLK